MDGPSAQLVLDPIEGVAGSLRMATHDPARDLVSRKLHQQRAWEVFESRLWLASHSRESVVLDVGANLGYYSLLSARRENPARRVFAFEPALDNFQLLRRNLALNDCDELVESVHGALGESDGRIVLHRSDDNRGDHQVYAGDGIRELEETRCYRGASFMAERGIERVDLLKLDTQGSELKVLRGLFPLLKSSAPTLRMLIELTPFSLQLAGDSGRALIALVEELDLPLYIVDHLAHELVASDGPALARWCDNVAATAGDRGFMNIFVGDPPSL